MEDKTPGQVAYEAQPDAAKKIPWNHLLPKKRGEWEVIAMAVISAHAAVRQMPHMPGARLRMGNTGAPIGYPRNHREQFMKVTTYGQIAYEAYRAASGGASLVSGEPLPAWEEQEERIQAAWNHAGSAVLDAVHGDGL